MNENHTFKTKDLSNCCTSAEWNRTDKCDDCPKNDELNNN